MIELYYNPKDARHILVMHDGTPKEYKDRKGTHRRPRYLCWKSISTGYRNTNSCRRSQVFSAR